jgi:hypothetical protein
MRADREEAGWRLLVDGCWTAIDGSPMGQTKTHVDG